MAIGLGVVYTIMYAHEEQRQAEEAEALAIQSGATVVGGVVTGGDAANMPAASVQGITDRAIVEGLILTAVVGSLSISIAILGWQWRQQLVRKRAERKRQAESDEYRGGGREAIIKQNLNRLASRNAKVAMRRERSNTATFGRIGIRRSRGVSGQVKIDPVSSGSHGGSTGQLTPPGGLTPPHVGSLAQGLTRGRGASMIRGVGNIKAAASKLRAGQLRNRSLQRGSGGAAPSRSPSPQVRGGTSPRGWQAGTSSPRGQLPAGFGDIGMASRSSEQDAVGGSCYSAAGGTNSATSSGASSPDNGNGGRAGGAAGGTAVAPARSTLAGVTRNAASKAKVKPAMPTMQSFCCGHGSREQSRERTRNRKGRASPDPISPGASGPGRQASVLHSEHI